MASATDKAASLRGSVLLVGPDGTGKSTVAESLASKLRSRQTTVVRGHFRPGLLPPRPRDGIVTEPHGQPARGAVATLVKVIHSWTDHWAGWATNWRRAAGSGVLIVERGFHDQLVDPARYRLAPAARKVLNVAGRLLPRFDVVVLLGGEASTVASRKGELDAVETRRQLAIWWRTVGGLGRTVLAYDSTADDPTTIAEGIACALEPGNGPHWFANRLLASRVHLVTSRPTTFAARVYRPTSRVGRLRQAVGQLIPPRHVPVPDVPSQSELSEWLNIDVRGVAVMNSSAPGRLVIGVDDGSRLAAVVKLGDASDRSLIHEAEVLETLKRGLLGIKVPSLIRSGPLGRRFAVATRAFGEVAAAVPTLDDASQLAATLADSAEPIVHGDFAPWNFIRVSGEDGHAWALIDFENARFGSEPLFDLSHFVVRSGELLGSWTPARAADLLCSVGSPGWKLLASTGLDPARATGFVLDYLDRSEPADATYRAELRVSLR